MKKVWIKLLPTLIILVTLVSVNQWSKIQIGNTMLGMVLGVFTIVICFSYYNKYLKTFGDNRFMILKLYFFWLTIGVVRGIFIAENYWEYKNLLFGTLALCLPVLIFPFSNPFMLHKVLSKWIKFALPSFFLFFIWVTSSGSRHYFLGPMILIACFVPALRLKWQFVILVCIASMLLGDIGARSQIIKGILAIFFSIVFLFRRFIPLNLIKLTHWLFYLLPVILLYLGITGTFNVFQDSTNKQHVEQKVVDGKVVNENLTADTRTLIYKEVIESAIKHNYVLWGRTPARGNDSVLFGEEIAKQTQTNRRERHANEICFPNVFTWLGLFGMLLYCSIYVTSSFLSVYKSKNFYMKLIGIYIAFHFAFGWIEDFNRLDISNISIWMAIAMGYSEKFRNLSNYEFATWLKTLFHFNRPLLKLYYNWSRNYILPKSRAINHHNPQIKTH